MCFNKNIDLAKKLNFFSNEGSLLVSVDEKREIINTFGLSKIELNNSSLPVIFDYPKETETFDKFATITIYPNPTKNNKINIQTDIVLDEIDLINIDGKLMQVIKKPSLENQTYTIDNLPQGIFFLKMTSENQSTTKSIIVN